jgi:hypothetical protein
MRELAFVLLLAGPLTGVASAQSASDVHVPAIEIATAFSYDLQRDGTADLPGGAGAIVAVSGNLNDHVAIVTQLADSPRMQAMMAGGRVSTGFYREGPGGPGRFFAELLAGPRRGGVSGSGSAIQLGVGSDALIVPRGLSLHLALDYLFLPGARHDFAGGRVSVGLVVGPHVVR